MNKVWINKKLVDSDKARISIFDRGFMYGDGLFETMRAYSGVIFEIDQHINRLFSSLKLARFSSPYPREILKREIYRTLKANHLKDAYIRLAMTRGEGRFGMEHKDVFSPNTVIITKEFTSYPSRMYNEGITAGVVGTRQNELSIISGIKSSSFLNYIVARLEAKRSGFDEAILANSKGHIAECATSNIFVVKGRNLITPSRASGILPGITRSVIMRLARKHGIIVKEALMTRRTLYGADEVFLTNSLAEVLPIVRIDRKKIGRGFPGPVTRFLHSAYRKEVARTLDRVSVRAGVLD